MPVSVPDVRSIIGDKMDMSPAIAELVTIKEQYF